MCVVSMILDTGLRLELLERKDPCAPFVPAQRHALAKDVHRQHTLEADAGAEHLAFLGKALAALHVEVVLVMQAAQQPPARARDLRGIEREVLVLCHRQAHRPQLGEPAGAAVLTAAAAHTREAPRFIAGADLPEVDAGAIQTREVAHEYAEVHSLVCREVDGNLAAGPPPLLRRNPHRETVFTDAVPHLASDVVLGAPQLIGGLDVLTAGAPQDAARCPLVPRLLQGAPTAAAATLLKGDVPPRQNQTHHLDPLPLHRY